MSPAEWLRGFLSTTFFSSLLFFPASPKFDVPSVVSTLDLSLRSLIFAHSTAGSSVGDKTPGPTSTLGFLFNVFCKIQAMRIFYIPLNSKLDLVINSLLVSKNPSNIHSSTYQSYLPINERLVISTLSSTSGIFACIFAVNFMRHHELISSIRVNPPG